MSWRLVTLTVPSGRGSFPSRRYSRKDDDFRSVLGDLVDHWFKLGARWAICAPGAGPLTTQTDLAVFLEQVPLILGHIDRDEDAMLSMYEQTAMFDVSIRVGPLLVIETKPWSEDGPRGIEHADRDALTSSLRAAMRHVIEDVKLGSPSYVCAWMEQWRKGAYG